MAGTFKSAIISFDIILFLKSHKYLGNKVWDKQNYKAKLRHESKK